MSFVATCVFECVCACTCVFNWSFNACLPQKRAHTRTLIRPRALMHAACMPTPPARAAVAAQASSSRLPFQRSSEQPSPRDAPEAAPVQRRSFWGQLTARMRPSGTGSDRPSVASSISAAPEGGSAALCADRPWRALLARVRILNVHTREV